MISRWPEENYIERKFYVCCGFWQKKYVTPLHLRSQAVEEGRAGFVVHWRWPNTMRWLSRAPCAQHLQYTPCSVCFGNLFSRWIYRLFLPLVRLLYYFSQGLIYYRHSTLTLEKFNVLILKKIFIHQILNKISWCKTSTELSLM